MTRKARNRFWVLLACIGLGLAVMTWVAQPYWRTLRIEHASRSYLDRLVTEIDGSDRIDLVEHSWYHMREWIVSLGMDPAADWQRLAEQAGGGA